MFSPNFKIELFENNHPGGSSGIKFVNNDKIFIFVTDNEIKLLKERGNYELFKKFCKGADIIAHDGQYLESEMKIKKGWGHTTIEDLMEFYIDVKPKIGIFTHHDPERKDIEIEEIEKNANLEVTKRDINIKILAAKEDMLLEI